MNCVVLSYIFQRREWDREKNHSDERSGEMNSGGFRSKRDKQFRRSGEHKDLSRQGGRGGGYPGGQQQGGQRGRERHFFDHNYEIRDFLNRQYIRKL